MLPITLLLLTLLISRSLFSLPDGSANPALAALVLASVTWLAGILFLPSVGVSDPEGNSLQKIFFWSLKITLIFLTAIALDPAIPFMFATTFRAAVMLFFLLSLILLVTTRFFRLSAGSQQIAFSVAAAFCALPVWLGPLVEISGNSPWLTNIVVGASPVTIFAVALDLDYLRTPWFYSNSVLGSLRYDYLSWSVYALVFMVGIIGLILTVPRTSTNSFFPFISKKENTS